jgi:TRAP-type C4-dicarboxylate transport system permease small subunit
MVRRSSASYVTLLLAIGLVVGRAIPVLAAQFDERVPVPGWSPAVLLAVFAGVVGVFAWTMWQQVHRDQRTISPNYGLRMVALAKAAVMVGGVFAGGYTGFALAFVAQSTDGDTLRFWQGLAASGASVLLLIAALLLERACQIPRRDDEDGESSAEPTPA